MVEFIRKHAHFCYRVGRAASQNNLIHYISKLIIPPLFCRCVGNPGRWGQPDGPHEHPHHLRLCCFPPGCSARGPSGLLLQRLLPAQTTTCPQGCRVRPVLFRLHRKLCQAQRPLWQPCEGTVTTAAMILWHSLHYDWHASCCQHLRHPSGVIQSHVQLLSTSVWAGFHASRRCIVISSLKSPSEVARDAVGYITHYYIIDRVNANVSQCIPAIIRRPPDLVEGGAFDGADCWCKI